MKNILLSVLLVISLPVLAKKKKPAHVACPTGAIAVIAAVGYPDIVRHNRGSLVALGPFNAAVDYQISKRFGFGFQYTYRLSGSELQSVNSPTYGVFQFEIKESFHSFMATADYYYRNRGRVCLSSGIGLGYTLKPQVSIHTSDNLPHSDYLDPLRRTRGYPAFRLRLLHIKYSVTKKIGVCGGLNYGIDGFVLVGAHYTFSGKRE